MNAITKVKKSYPLRKVTDFDLSQKNIGNIFIIKQFEYPCLLFRNIVVESTEKLYYKNETYGQLVPRKNNYFKLSKAVNSVIQ